MAFPIEFLDLEDIGREVLVTLAGNVSHQGTITGIHAVRASDGELEVSIDTDDIKDLLLKPDTYVFYTDDAASV